MYGVFGAFEMTEVVVGRMAKVLQDRVDLLEELLAQERTLCARNAEQAIKFHNVLHDIATYHGGDDGALFRSWACGTLGLSGLE
jgi:hypothetical protein